MSLVIDTLISSTISEKLKSIEAEIIDGLFDVQDYKSGRVIAQSEVKQSENKPGDLGGISTFDYKELLNYIYGVNGRY
jgi:hypothetical protein